MHIFHYLNICWYCKQPSKNPNVAFCTYLSFLSCWLFAFQQKRNSCADLASHVGMARYDFVFEWQMPPALLLAAGRSSYNVFTKGKNTCSQSGCNRYWKWIIQKFLPQIQQVSCPRRNGTNARGTSYSHVAGCYIYPNCTWKFDIQTQAQHGQMPIACNLHERTLTPSSSWWFSTTQHIVRS